MDDYTSKSNTVGFVPLGGSADGLIETLSDGDWLRVQLTQGITYQIDVFGFGSDPLNDPRAQLRTADRVTLASDDNSGSGTAARMTHTPTETSDYYVQVSETGRDDTGGYRVTLSQQSTGTPPTEPPPAAGTADFGLSLGQSESGRFGNKYDGSVDQDGVIKASFENTGVDTRLSLSGFDIDFANEVEVLLNGSSIGFLSKGANNGLNGGDSFLISAGDQISGTNIITFEQNISNSYKWGITDIRLDAAGSEPPTPPPTSSDITLTLGQTETGSFGNKFNNVLDADGVVSARFQNTGVDTRLTLDGFDIDFSNEVEVLLNGDSLGFLSKGSNNGLNGGDSFLISAGDQSAGTNTLTFEQNISNSYKWGVTDILLQEASETPPPAEPTVDLNLSTTPSGNFGNKFDGRVDADGVITASFQNTGDDAVLRLQGFDIDFANEVSVNLNGDRIGFLSKGANNGLNGGDEFTIEASAQKSGTNIITFEQEISNSYKWGVSDVSLVTTDSPPPTTGPGPAPGTTDGVLDVMVIGDSFSIAGRGLQGKIEATLEQRGYGETEIIDLAKSGRNIFGARDAVLEYLEDADANIPEVAILAIGINDALALRVTSDLDRVLDRTIDELQDRGVEVLLAVPEPFYPLKSGTQGYTDLADQEAFRAVYDDLASENGLVIARDFIDGLLDDPSLLEGDVFHPNPAGVDKILDNILPELEQVIDRALPEPSTALASLRIEDIVASDGGTS